MEIAEVKAFNAELSALYENRPPISKAKMGAITRGAIKAIKFYKHVVHSVEKFILKCKPEYKIPGLYVIDSIVRQSRHQFGADKDVFAPRFAKNMQITFANLLRCPPEDKRNIIRVLNLWQKNSVFGPDVIQPLFDMADPNHPIHQELLAQQPQHTNGSLNLANAESKGSPSLATQHTPTITPNQEMRGHDSAPSTNTPQQNQVNFNRRLLNVDFEYESEDDGAVGDSSPPSRGPVSLVSQSQPPPAPVQNPQLNNNFLMNPLSNLQSLNPQDPIGSILTNPEVLRHIQSLQTHLFIPNFSLPANNMMSQDMNYVDTSQPPPMLMKQDELNNARSTSPLLDEVNNESDIEFVDDAGPQVIEIDGNDSRSPSPKNSRRRRSRSRDRSRRSRSRSRRSRSRSRDRRRRSRDRSRDRDRGVRDKPRDKERDKEREKEREREREKERERRKKGLPPIRKETLSVCSTTLWVGHLSKLVQEEELSDAFGAFGDVISIDLVPPRGCAFIVMNRRRDASRAIAKLNKQKMHGKAITVAWAPGKGVKGREWKDFWEAEAGACYIPWSRLPDGGGLAVLQGLEEGGVMDEETLPAWLQPKALTADIKPKPMTDISAVSTGLLSSNAPGMMVMSPLAPPQGLGVDTSCLPPPLGPLGYAPHPALPMPLPLLGFKPSPQTGLQALHLQAVLAHQQQQQLATQMLLGPPPRLPPHPLSAMGTPLQSSLPMIDSRQDDAMELDTGDDVHTDMLQSLSETTKKLLENDTQINEKFKALVSNPPPSFSIPPPLLPRQGLLGKPPLLPNQNFSVTSQPPPSFNMVVDQNNLQNLNERDKDKRERDGGRKDRERRDRDRERDRPRDRHERERDRERDRDRDRDRSERERGERERGVEKDRERNEKDRDRERERGRERGNRWGGREQRGTSRDRSPGGVGRHGAISNVNNERSLQDRLWEMANGPGPRPQRGDSPSRSSRNDRSGKDSHNPDSLLGDGPAEMDRRKGPHSSRSLSPSGIMGPNGPIGLNNSLGPNGPMGPNGPIGPIGGMGMMGPNISMMGRSPLPPMAPFRIGRDEMRMRSMGPRGPLLRPGLWVDGPGQFGPRFNGGPPFNRASFDGLPYDRSYDGPPYDRSPFDRSHFDGPGRPPFEGPRFEGGPIYDGPPESYFNDRNDRNERNGPRGPRSVRGSEGRRPRDRDNEGRERPNRSSRWAECESPEKVIDKTDSNDIKNPTETESEPKQDSPSTRLPIDDSDAQENASPNSNTLPITDHITEESNEPANMEPATESDNSTSRTTPIMNDNTDTNENTTSNQDISEEIPKNQPEAPPESNESFENDGAEEGRGTPCRDEPVNNATTTPDLTDP